MQADSPDEMHNQIKADICSMVGTYLADQHPLIIPIVQNPHMLSTLPVQQPLPHIPQTLIASNSLVSSFTMDKQRFYESLAKVKLGNFKVHTVSLREPASKVTEQAS